MEQALFKQKIKKELWYKEPWMILVIGGPLFVVIACIYTINLAFNGADQVVAKDYYRQGLMINTNLLRDAKARELNLNAQLQIDFSNHSLTMKLSSKEALPELINLSIASSGAVNSSVEEVIRRLPMQQTSAGVYYGKFEQQDAFVDMKLLHVKLETNEWRLTGDWHNPKTQALHLIPSR